MENTVKIASLISYVTSVAGKAIPEQDVTVILKMIAELRADYVPLNRLLNAMQGERKIEAIKEYRTLTGCTLLDAKNAVESNWFHARFNTEGSAA